MIIKSRIQITKNLALNLNFTVVKFETLKEERKERLHNRIQTSKPFDFEGKDKIEKEDWHKHSEIGSISKIQSESNFDNLAEEQEI